MPNCSSIPVFFSHLLGSDAYEVDPVWTAQYKKVLTSGLWKVNQLDVFETAIGAVVDQYLEKNWSSRAASGEWFDLSREMQRIVALVNLRVFFGETALQTRGDIWQDIFPELDKLSVDQIVSNAPWLPFGRSKRFFEVKTQVFDLVKEFWENLVEEVRGKYERDQSTILFDAYGEILAFDWEDKLSVRTVTDHTLAVAFAAHINTANVLLWTTAMVAQGSAHVDEILREATGNSSDSDDSKAPVSYSFACLREATRLYPILSTIRIAIKDTQIPGTEFWAKKGDLVGVTPLRAHRNSEFFPDPDTFNPSRFRSEETVRSTSNSFQYNGFGHGGHRCLGERFVLRIARRWLQGVFLRFHVELKEEKLPEPIWSTISNPAPATPLMARIKPRQ